VQDLLTDKLATAVRKHVQGFFAERRKPGQVPVTDCQLDFIRQIVGRYDNVVTPHIALDVATLREEAHGKQVGVEVLVCSRLSQLCADLDHCLGEMCKSGDRLLFMLVPEAHLVREHFELKMYVWTHVCVVEPKRPPAPSTVPVAEARKIVQEADDAGARAGSPNYFR
jgi:hypothetical protein